MAKKKTSGSPAARAATDTTPTTPAAPRRRAAASRTTTPSSETPSMADDRVATMPEPAGQRVSPADTSAADSVTFDTMITSPQHPTYDQIAEAAYHRYLSRGGGDGRDFDDWIEAEKSLKTR